LVKSKNPDGKPNAEKVLFMAAESLRISGILLQPFLPDKAAKLLDTLGVAEDMRTFEHAVPRCDFSYGVPAVNPGRCRDDSLFPPLIEDTDVDYHGSFKTRRKATSTSEIVQTEN
jgi:methionyl-tRNA synthetase